MTKTFVWYTCHPCFHFQLLILQMLNAKVYIFIFRGSWLDRRREFDPLPEIQQWVAFCETDLSLGTILSSQPDEKGKATVLCRFKNFCIVALCCFEKDWCKLTVNIMNEKTLAGNPQLEDSIQRIYHRFFPFNFPCSLLCKSFQNHIDFYLFRMDCLKKYVSQQRFWSFTWFGQVS